MTRGKKNATPPPGSLEAWWLELPEKERSRLMAEFRAARERDYILQALYPDDDSPPLAWLINRRAGVRFESFI